MITLRPYQHDALVQLDGALDAGYSSPLLVLPTGSGKTVIAAELMSRADRRGERCLFLAPRRELVHQTIDKIAAAGIESCGVLMAGDDRRSLYARLQVASVETLLARMVRRQCLTLPRFDWVLVDEAHLSVTKARCALLEHFAGARTIGLTATPTRKDGRALGALYDVLIEPATPAMLTAAGYLVRARYFSVSEPDLSRVRVLAGEYNAGELAEVMERPQLVGDVVQHWMAHAGGRRSLVFATSIRHSIALAAEFTRNGICAEHVDATTPQGERDAIFGRFRAGATQVLTNCFLASYGFDLPQIACIVLARPTRSLMLYLQMLGRGLRPAEGKTDCLVLDHSGAVHRHGFATDERHWTLDGHHSLDTREDRRERSGEPTRITCPQCHCVFTGALTCPECGYHLQPAGKSVATLDGELIELGQQPGEDHAARVEFYRELKAIAEERGYRGAWAAHQYRERHGAFPPWAWNALPPVMPTVTTRRWVLSRVIAYRKAMDKARRAQVQEG